MGRKGGGIPQAFDPDDWDEITSMIDVPVYVSKGRGMYEGEGGFMTTLLSALTAVANNPTVMSKSRYIGGGGGGRDRGYGPPSGDHKGDSELRLK
eukprot:COSAG06_NODE_1303_length_9931_cov_69.878255_7_plen_95_part_00